MKQRYRKSIIPALFKLIPLILWWLVLFTGIWIIGSYWFAMWFWLFVLFLCLYVILDDYMDYIEIKETSVLLKDQRWLFRENITEISYSEIASVSLDEWFLQKLYFAWDIKIVSEWKWTMLKWISWAKRCVEIINNKLQNV